MSAPLHRPCRTFPSEVEELYCTCCHEPCSALSCLVGPHTNHAHVRLIDALATVPNDIQRELSSFTRRVALHVRHAHDTAAHLKESVNALQDTLLDIDEGIRRLQYKRLEVEEQLSEAKDRLDTTMLVVDAERRQLMDVGHQQSFNVQYMLPLFQRTQELYAVTHITASGAADAYLSLEQAARQFDVQLAVLRNHRRCFGSSATAADKEVLHEVASAAQRQAPSMKELAGARTAARTVDHEALVAQLTAARGLKTVPVIPNPSTGTLSSSTSSDPPSPVTTEIATPRAGRQGPSRDRIVAGAGQAHTEAKRAVVPAAHPPNKTSLERLMAQYQDLRRCLADAAEEKHTELVRILLRGVKAIRRQAKEHNVPEIEAAILRDPIFPAILE